MTRMTDYGLHAILPDGEHIYYGYDEKPDVATGKALAICTRGIRYIPLTTLKKHEHLLNMNIGGVIMHPIEDSLTFTIETWFEKSGNGSSGPIPYVEGNYYLKFNCDTTEEVTINSFDFIMTLNGEGVSKIYSNTLYLMDSNPSRVIYRPPNYFEYQGESSFQQVEWKLPNHDTGKHDYYTFQKYK